MKQDKTASKTKDDTKAKKDKATSDGGKDKNPGGMPASQLKADSGKTGRSGGKGA